MAKNNHLFNMHAKGYIDSVFVKRLQEEGFICPDDRHLCWYRINGDIVNSIIFYSSWTQMPIYLEVGYGIHPLFQKPAYTTNVNYHKRPIENELLCGQPLVENCPVNEMRYTCYSSDIQVYAPGRDGRGLYTLEGVIFPKMEHVDTIKACYHLHKQWYMGLHHENPAIKFSGLSAVFIDEVIYVGDTDMFPYCRKRIENVIKLRQKNCLDNPDNKEYQIALREWEQRRAALFDGKREKYCEILDKRKKDNIGYLGRKMKILF